MIFFPPESNHQLSSLDLKQVSLQLESATPWDIATRYHEFKTHRSVEEDLAKKLRRLSASAILERAQEVLGSVVHPVDQGSAPLNEVPENALHAEFDFEETLEASPLAVSGLSDSSQSEFPLTESDLWMGFSVLRKQALILSVDTSLSMTGEKLALTAVALAVVLLEFPEDPIGIIAFENEAQILKHPEEKISIPELVERFLDVPAQGYTHLEDGMRASLRLAEVAQRLVRGRPASTVLLTDGKYTAGRDPAYLAPQFSHLVVLKMGREKASLELCRELAKKGRGALREVEDLNSLPGIMYNVVKDLLRGRSLN